MSRLSKKSIPLPPSVTAEERQGKFVVKGPKGELSVALLPDVSVSVGSEGIMVSHEGSSGTENVGTVWSLLQNAVAGVSEGFSKVLEIEGVGYRASIEGKALVLALGFSHPVRFEAPEGITISAEKNTITISGMDKELVGQVAAKIRSFKKPEPYKGKGIHYAGEVIRRKVGKKAATAGT